MKAADSPSSSKGRLRPFLYGGGAVVVIGVLTVAWWLGFLTPEPDPVSITEAVDTVSAESESAESESAEAEGEAESSAETDGDESTDESTEATTDVTDVAITSITGEWSVVESDATFIGYRADSNTGESVGRSPAVTGTLTATDTEITAVDIVGDLSQLESDSSVRDEHLSEDGLETNTFPTATFVLTEPIAISGIPDVGVEETFTAVGELTVKDITQPVSIELQAVVIDDKFVVAGSTFIALEDFDATIGDVTEATMEFSLVFSL